MLSEEHRHLLEQLLLTDPFRMRVLSTLKRVESNLQSKMGGKRRSPNLFVAAGFLRNLVWDALHNKTSPTPLNDIDVIYYDKHSKTSLEQDIELALNSRLDVKWQVRNQAFIHLRNEDPPYKDLVDAMRYWPEKETGLAARLDEHDDMHLLSAYDANTLFTLQITPSGRRPISLVNQRVNEKKWLSTWPKLRVECV